jgi:hypothetical protein
MANPFDPALYLYLQSAVGVSDTAGYTRLLGKPANQQYYLEFSNSAIEAGFGVPAANTTANVPVEANIRLYFNDPAYGPPPPPPKLPVEPIHPPVHQRLGPILPGPGLPGVYVASDGTPLMVNTADGQITGFSGMGKDGHNYSLSTAIVTEKAPGRQAAGPAAVDVLWLKASLSITMDGGDALIFAFRFAPTANLFQVSLEQNHVSTAINVDYSGATGPNGTAQLTRTLLYYGNSFMAQGLQVPASQQDPGMYLAAACSFWPMIDWVDFFGPALQKVAEESTPVVATPLAAIGSVNLLNYLPAQYPLAKYLSQAEKTAGPALGPLAASFVDTTLPFGSLAPAAMWLGLLTTNTGTGQQALITELTAAYQEWVAFIESQASGGQDNRSLNPLEPEEGDG